MKDTREKDIVRVTLGGSLVNFFLLVFKFIAGFWGHSSAMIADAVHSLSDFVTDVIVLVFINISSKPKDEGHEYGHGKYETLATSIIGIVLLCVGVGLFWEGMNKIIGFYFRGEPLESPGKIALVAALVSIVVKEGLFRWTLYVGKEEHSQAVVANAWHHRSDAFSSIGTTLGIGGAILLGEEWRVLDPIAAVVVREFFSVSACSSRESRRGSRRRNASTGIQGARRKFQLFRRTSTGCSARFQDSMLHRSQG